jgi:hypothetical protein
MIKILKKILIKKLAKENETTKKTGLKSDRKKSNEDEIQKQLSQFTIKRIETKLKRLKNHKGWN